MVACRVGLSPRFLYRGLRASTLAVVAAVLCANGAGVSALGQSKSKRKGSEAKSTRANYDDLARAAERLPWRRRPLLAGTPDGRLVAIVDGDVFERAAPGGEWTALGPTLESASAVSHPVALGITASGGWRALLRDGRVVEASATGERRVVASLALDGGSVAVDGAFDAEPQWVALNSATNRRGVVFVADGDMWRQDVEVPGPIVAVCRVDGVWRVVANDTVYESASRAVKARSRLVGANVYGMTFRTSLRGWIAADKGMLVETNDGGERWLPKPLGGDLVFEWIGFVTPTVGYATAVAGGRARRGHVFASRDGGETWTDVGSGADPLSAPVVGASGTMCILDADGTLLHSSASGAAKPAGRIRSRTVRRSGGRGDKAEAPPRGDGGARKKP
jgi:hypothetical protein